MTDILRISAPLTVWLVAFSAVYGLNGLVCSARWTQAGLDLATGRAVMAAAWAVAAALQIALLLALRSRRFVSPSPWMRWLSLNLGLVALVATLWTLLPTATASACL